MPNMPVVKPPTDSLYKFCAILGLTIVSGTIVLVTNHGMESERTIIELEHKVDLRKIENKNMQDEHVAVLEGLQAKDKELEKFDRENPKPTDEQVAKLNERSREIIKRARDYIEKSRSGLEQESDLGRDAKMASLKVKSFTMSVYFSPLLLGLGLLFSYYGFKGWIKVQVLQDKILEKKANKPSESESLDQK